MKRRFWLHLFDPEKQEFWETSDFIICPDEEQILLDHLTKLFKEKDHIFLAKNDDIWHIFDQEEQVLGLLKPI